MSYPQLFIANFSSLLNQAFLLISITRNKCFNWIACTQWRNEVRWLSGQEASLAPPCSNLRSSRSKCAVLKEVLVTLLELFGAWGIVPPHVTPLLALLWGN